jgi:hypothetical protein
VVTVYPGLHGRRSMGVEVCMSLEALGRRATDREFVEVVEMA